MHVLQYGSRGAQVALLQLALQRAGYTPGDTDGIFGNRTKRALQDFQAQQRLQADGIAGPRTHSALEPYYTGYLTHTVRAGDTLYKLSQQYGTSLQAIETANAVNPLQLPIGYVLTIPLPFPVVPTEIPWGSETVRYVCQGLQARYPMLQRSVLGRSVLGRELWALQLGTGPHRVLYHATHHANEWINTPLLLRYVEQLCQAAARDEELHYVQALSLLSHASFLIVPCVNPDGMDLVTGDLAGSRVQGACERIAAQFPEIAFPNGWKANIRGVDLNLQYPALWERAREIKFAQGYTQPAPRDYVGQAPLTQPECIALYRATRRFDPALTLSFHSQGETIYYQFQNLDIPDSYAIGQRLAEVSGYTLASTPPESAYAGYKDWFMQDYLRPGYTIETGRGTNPLPLTQFAEIERACAPLMTAAALI